MVNKSTAKSLVAKLAVIDEDIKREAAEQPQAFIAAARYRVDKMRNRAAAVAKYEEHRASLGLRMRARRDSGGKKPSEGNVKDAVESNSLTQKLHAEMQVAYAYEEFAKLLLEAYRQRRDGIRIIHEAQLAEGGGEMREVLRNEERNRSKKRAIALDRQRRGLEADDDDDE